MRIDVAPANDSDGFSLVSAAAVPAIIEDARAGDRRFVAQHVAMLFLMVGDDELRVRVVIDEDITPEERAACVTRIAGLLDLRGGALLVCAGFDPGCFAAWQEHGVHEGVASVPVPPGWYRVAVSATLGSMNGRALAGDGAPGLDPGYGWLVQLAHTEAGDVAGLTEVDESGWFDTEAGRSSR